MDNARTPAVFLTTLVGLRQFVKPFLTDLFANALLDGQEIPTLSASPVSLLHFGLD